MTEPFAEQWEIVDVYMGRRSDINPAPFGSAAAAEIARQNEIHPELWRVAKIELVAFARPLYRY